MRPLASAACAAAIALRGAGCAGCPTSIWMTRVPLASSAAAAAITSITMNGGTALRREGASRRFAASSIMIGQNPLKNGCNRPALAAFPGLLAAALTASRSVTSFTPIPGGTHGMIETATPIRARRRAPAARALAVLTALALAVGPVAPSLHAQEPQLPIIRDTEIENLLRDYGQPVLRAAGLAQQNVKVVILNDRTFNAFVMDGRHIFINAGTLFDAKTPNEIIGVFAHETGHLAGGHLMRLREEMSRAQTASIVALLLGVGAAVAGARSGATGDIAGAALTAPQSAILRSVLAYVRTQEDQAD